MPFISNTETERKEMLKEIGVNSFNDLIKNIPESIRLKKDLNLEEPLSELELTRRINCLASKNNSTEEINSFLGGGIYDHFIPAAVGYIQNFPQFQTAYTPYQAEVSQGTLQAIYEYQTMIAHLTGMYASNAGMYDGASATAEAILLSCRQTRKSKVLVSEAINPRYLEVIKIYTEGIGVEIIKIPVKNGVTDISKIEENIDKETASVVMQSPNFFGNIEDMFAVKEKVKLSKKTLLISAVDPISLALLNSPSEYGADIVVGEGQALGSAMNFGGPTFGFLATNKKLIRKIPGRIVGETVDADGKKGYCLTLQTREQHIRREKATSNICSNQALCNLGAGVYLSLLGKEGLKEVAEHCVTKAHYLANEITKIEGFELVTGKDFFKEFAVKSPINVKDLLVKLREKNILAGIDLTEFGYENHLLIAVTEKKTKEDMDSLVKAIQEVKNA